MEDKFSSIAPFLFETAMLKRVERTGYAFLGSGKESVAAHVYGMSMAAMALAAMRPDVNLERMLLMCLVHDLPETRTGDANAVHKLYISRDENKAMEDICEDLPFAEILKDAWEEFSKGESEESRLVQDADQLDMLISLKEQHDTGSRDAEKWIPYVKARLRSSEAQKLGELILKEHWAGWWMRKLEI